MTLDFATIWSVIDKGGVLAMCTFLIVAFAKGWIVPRYVYDAAKERGDKFEALAMKSVSINEVLARPNQGARAE